MTTNADKVLVILDLDETLIHATDKPCDEHWDFEVFHYKVYKRPFLEEFLTGLAGNFDVAVWSSASDDYVALVVKEIFPSDYPLRFVWGRSRCTYKPDYRLLDEFGFHDPFSHYDYVKRLDKVRRFGYSKERMLIIDDTPRKCIHNYGNAIYPAEYLGGINDNELLLLLRYLGTLKDLDTVRHTEKRNWRDEAQKLISPGKT